MSRRIGGFGITTGPASLMLIDPDGNPVLIDQHVDSLRNSEEQNGGKNTNAGFDTKD